MHSKGRARNPGPSKKCCSAERTITQQVRSKALVYCTTVSAKGHKPTREEVSCDARFTSESGRHRSPFQNASRDKRSPPCRLRQQQQFAVSLVGIVQMEKQMADAALQNPTSKFPKPPFKRQTQPWPTAPCGSGVSTRRKDDLTLVGLRALF
jgi:hypothetical protein